MSIVRHLNIAALAAALTVSPAIGQNRPAGGGGAPAKAPATAPAARQVLVTHFTPAILIRALADAGVPGAAARQEKAKDGSTVDIVSFTVGSTKHVGILSVCSGAQGCLAVELLTVWADAGKTANRTALNAYNAGYGFGKGFVEPNGTLVYQRYAISDGGVTMDHVRANIGNFVNGSQAFEAYMSKQTSGSTASAAPAAGAPQLASGTMAPATEDVILSLGVSQGLNILSAAPAASKPAQ